MAKVLHETRFPGETQEYREARMKLLEAEIGLRRQIEAVAAQRRSLPDGGEVKTDYAFESSAPGEREFKTIRFSELFRPGKSSLFLYSFMFPERVGSMTPCPSCTSIIDAVDGAAQHLEQRINFAVVAKAPIQMFRKHGDSRGWRNVTLLSSANNHYNREYHAEGPDGGQNPIATVFVRRGNEIHHFWSSELFFAPAEPGQGRRHVDFMWPMWSILDRTPEGRGTDWGPSLSYS
jgi:predicted dithiol-disulfide oxidoreductase (DUF899 family)